METKKTQDLYQLISQKLNDIIPCEWTKIYLYAEVLDDSTMVLFHFRTPGNNQIIYSQDIPSHYNVSKDIFKTLLRKLRELFEELRTEHRNNNDDVWTNLTLTLDSSGKFQLDYNYDDILASEFDGYERIAIWEYKNLGILPEDEDDKEFVISYLGL
ncbi:antitoxin YezG family protein [Bacillus subtilis]|uniref:antitoxin YezG family protein n=1 Tax=Bacillus subtilis group TaxID=653685 RepID=UPI0005F90227|nr:MULTISPECIES: antitoxin YezG family protein [Bacillus subtilis group]MBZ6489634.1 antitoxin YezG family protein [Bacillus subtilis subsp. subtilis]MCL6427176.1 antitoxin YezG family protein [Bacillus subtilis]MDH3120039.1 antitoxin YezG family protein [Bacillus subtilis]MEC3621336.1 antitoxin YezG family protein [Bacillus subtilis]MEC3633261.1 antitoxin YezG family protein [Bacillus subtilis]